MISIRTVGVDRHLRKLALLMGLIMAAPLLSACGPPISAIEMALEDRSADHIKSDTKIKAGIITDINNRMSTKLAALLNVDVYEGRVLLTGEVENRADRNKAGDIARNHPGTGKVINEIQVVPPEAESSLVDDVVIEKKFYGKLASTSGVSHTNWRWRSVNGTLYLFGRALSKGEMNKVVSIAKDTENVRKVVNHTFVRPK